MSKSGKNFVYDPERQGFDTAIWKVLSGTISVVSNKIRLVSAEIIQYIDVLRGVYSFKTNIAPTTPANGYLTGGGSATAVFGTWEAVTDGEFAITIDGVAYDITGIDFTGVTDMDEVAAVIQTALQAETAEGTETVVWDTDHFVITGRLSVSVTSAVSGGSGTDISGAGATAFLDADTGNGTATAGTDKEFGLKQLSKDIYAVFRVYGAKLRCYVKNSTGNIQYQDVPWSSAWTNTDTLFCIRWGGQGVDFEVGGVRVASKDGYVPNSAMSIYARNGNADNVDIAYIEVTGSENYISGYEEEKVSGVPTETFSNGAKDVTTAGTAVPLAASSTPFKNLDVQALDTNTGKIYIGGSGVSSASGVFLFASNSRNYKDGDLADIYIDADVNGEGVVFSYEV